MNEEEIYQSLLVVNKRCEPPLEEKEIRGIAHSIGKYKTPNDPSVVIESNELAFPLDALPITIRRFVEETAEALPCPPDFIAIPTITGAGAAIGTRRFIEVKKEWKEYPVSFRV